MGLFLPLQGSSQTAREALNMIERLRDFLEGHEAENHLFLGVLSTAPQGARPVLAEEAGEIRAACMFVERNVVAAGETSRVAQLISQWQVDAPGVVARADLATAWAEQWAHKRGCQTHLAVSQRIFRLDQVTPPRPVPGRLRLAGVEDVELLADWIEGFDRDALAHERSPRSAIESGALRRARSGMTYLWEVEGRPVSMAALARPSRHAILRQPGLYPHRIARPRLRLSRHRRSESGRPRPRLSILHPVYRSIQPHFQFDLHETGLQGGLRLAPLPIHIPGFMTTRPAIRVIPRKNQGKRRGG